MRKGIKPRACHRMEVQVCDCECQGSTCEALLLRRRCPAERSLAKAGMSMDVSAVEWFGLLSAVPPLYPVVVLEATLL